MKTLIVYATKYGSVKTCAEKIKEKAKELEIEIVENKPIARSLNEMTEIGDEIPVDLYQAVAEILAFVFKNNNKYQNWLFDYERKGEEWLTTTCSYVSKF